MNNDSAYLSSGPKWKLAHKVVGSLRLYVVLFTTNDFCRHRSVLGASGHTMECI